MSGLKKLLIKIQKTSSRKWSTSSPANSTAALTTKSIDDHLQKKADDQNRTLNILFLGAGGGGKSAILKQMYLKYNKGIFCTVHSIAY